MNVRRRRVAALARRLGLRFAAGALAALPTLVVAASGGPGTTVDGSLVLAALQTGVSDDPTPANPMTRYRRLQSPEGEVIHLGGRYTSHILATGFPGARGVGAWDVVRIEPTMSDGAILAVEANGMALGGPRLDLATVDPVVGRPVATWSNGPWSVSLVVQSVPERPDLMRVCWDAILPAPEPVTGPPGHPPLVRTAPFKRLSCGVYDRHRAGPDRGGYLVDDLEGRVVTYAGSW